MKPCIALVEDDPTIQSNYADFLRGCGLDVDTYSSKQEALDGLTRKPPEMVLLDITLDGERDAGFDICSGIRLRDAQLPIIFLSSHEGEIYKISGLRLGADDYITKDVSLDFLFVRIQALFRRRDAYRTQGAARNAGSSLAGQGLELDSTASIAVWRARRVNLSLTQFWMLAELCRQPGEVRSHRELMQAGRIVVEQNTITAHVKAIRDAFREVDPEFDCIATERGRGYRWLAS